MTISTIPDWVPSAQNPETVFVKDGERWKFEARYFNGKILVTHAFGQRVPEGCDPEACYEYSPEVFCQRYFLDENPIW